MLDFFGNRYGVITKVCELWGSEPGTVLDATEAKRLVDSSQMSVGAVADFFVSE